MAVVVVAIFEERHELVKETVQGLQGRPTLVGAALIEGVVVDEEMDFGDHQVADGVGFTPSGEHIDVMVWANSNGLSALDLVDYSGSGQLPVAESICSFEELSRGEKA